MQHKVSCIQLEAINMKNIFLHAIFICGPISFLTASESEWQNVTQKLLPQVKTSQFIAVDIKNIDNKLCILGTFDSPQKKSSIVFLEFDKDIKKLEETTIPNITQTTDITLGSTNKTPIIQAITNNKLNLYKIKTKFIYGSYLEPITNLYLLNNSTAIIGGYSNAEFWTCANNACYLNGSQLSHSNILHTYIPSMVGLEPNTIDNTNIYWTIKDNIIKKFAFNEKAQELQDQSFKYDNTEIQHPFQHYAFKQLIPYNRDSAIALGEFTQPGSAPSAQIIGLHLDMHEKVYSIVRINTPEKTNAIAVIIKNDEGTLYALSKNNDTFSIQQLLLRKPAIEKRISPSSTPQTPQKTPTAIPKKPVPQIKKNKLQQVAKKEASPTKKVTQPNPWAQVAAYLKTNTPELPKYNIEEDSIIQDDLDPNEDFNEIGWDDYSKKLTIDSEKMMENSFTWELNSTNNAIIANNEEAKPYFMNIKRKIIKLIPTSSKEGFAQGEDGRVYSIKLIDKSDNNINIAYFEELKYDGESINAENIIPIGAAGKIGIIHQPYLNQDQLKVATGITIDSYNPKELAQASRRAAIEAQSTMLKPEFLIVNTEQDKNTTTANSTTTTSTTPKQPIPSNTGKTITDTPVNPQKEIPKKQPQAKWWNRFIPSPVNALLSMIGKKINPFFNWLSSFLR